MVRVSVAPSPTWNTVLPEVQKRRVSSSLFLCICPGNDESTLKLIEVVRGQFGSGCERQLGLRQSADSGVDVDVLTRRALSIVFVALAKIP